MRRDLDILPRGRPVATVHRKLAPLHAEVRPTWVTAGHSCFPTEGHPQCLEPKRTSRFCKGVCDQPLKMIDFLLAPKYDQEKHLKINV